MSASDSTEPVFDDLLFRQKRKHGKYRLVAPPSVDGALADSHAHVHLLQDPHLEFVKCAAWGVDFVCDIIDIYEDDAALVLESITQGARVSKELISEVYAHSAEAAQIQNKPEGTETSDCLPRRSVVEACISQPKVRFALGCHPHNAKHYNDELEAQLIHLLADPRISAIGEIGLDYHYDLSPREDQRQAFRRQIRLSHITGLPIALHLREAHVEAYSILKEEGFPEAGVLLHCCSLSPEKLKPWIEAGCFIAYGGALTFKSAEEARQGAALVPVDKLLLETDSPYMTPEPMRGMPCGPAHTLFTAECLCEVFGCVSQEERNSLLAQVHENTLAFLARKPTAWQLSQGVC